MTIPKLVYNLLAYWDNAFSIPARFWSEIRLVDSIFISVSASRALKFP